MLLAGEEGKALHIIVLVKQVPDMAMVRFDTEKGVIDRSSAQAEINPFDLNALEAAVQVKEETGGRVTVLSMGPETAEAALKEALARGADEAILLNDPAFAGADTWATALTLSRAVRKLGEYHLITAGVMTVDGDTAQVGPEVAEFLGIPHAAFITGMREFSREAVTVASESSGGTYLKRLDCPCLLTVTRDCNTPRLPALRDKLKARKARAIRWGLAELETGAGEVGKEGSLTRVQRIVVPPPVARQGRLFGEEEGEEGLEALLGLLRENKILQR